MDVIVEKTLPNGIRITVRGTERDDFSRVITEISESIGNDTTNMF